MSAIYDKKKGFKNTSVVVSQALKIGEQGRKIVYLYDTFKKSDIVHVKGNCKCTANFSWSEDRLIVTYNDHTTADEMEGRSSIKQTKTLQVFLNDGLPLHEFNENGVEVLNTQKDNITLSFDVVISV